jgi:hypothetical protein
VLDLVIVMNSDDSEYHPQTGSNLIEGRWQLMFTTRPGTASPIQVRLQFVAIHFCCAFHVTLFLSVKYWNLS